jgi:hypothetical protein
VCHVGMLLPKCLPNLIRSGGRAHASAPAGMDGTCATKIRATGLLGRAVGSRAFQSMLRHSRGQCCLYSDLSRFFRSAVTTPLPLRRWH